MGTSFSRDLYMRALNFASARHLGQKMPGSENPYVIHVAAVAMEVLATFALEEVPDADLAVACALLHDTVEDTEATREEVAAEFGEAVAAGVVALSKDPALPKEQQLADSLARIRMQPRAVWLVKLADRAVNLEAPPHYWSMDKRRAYLREAGQILDALGEASPSMAARLRDKRVAYEAFISGA